MSKQLKWIGLDWGTSNVRCWGLDEADEIVFSSSSDKGMGSLKSADYPNVVSELTAGHLTDEADGMSVIVCGMAGAREGWREAGYLPLPAKLTDLCAAAVNVPVDDARFSVSILPGMCVRKEGEEDVMRGEETQLLGLSALKPDFNGLACLPGTHSKWVSCNDGTVTTFKTAMTGELFEVIKSHSVLRHSLKDSAPGPEQDDGMEAGLDAGLSHPEHLLANLFRTRAAGLLSDKSASWASGYLSGLLIGSEIGAMKHQIGSEPLPIIGSTNLGTLYAQALKKIGVESFVLEGDTAVLAGLGAAQKAIHG